MTGTQIAHADRALALLGGEANDANLVVVVCRNCHALLTEAARDSGVDLRRRPERGSPERLESVLRGLADFFLLLAPSLGSWADEVRRVDNSRRDES